SLSDSSATDLYTLSLHDALPISAPSGVSCSLRVERLTRRAPRRASSRAISLLTADGVMRSWRAAAEKLPASTTRANTSISPERLISGLAIVESISQKICRHQGWFTEPGVTIFRGTRSPERSPSSQSERPMPLAL